MPKKTLEQWLLEVDRCVQAKIGLSYLDLPDCPYSVWHEDGMSAKSAAAKAIRMAND